MAARCGPKISTSDISLYYDAAVLRSYVGSGITVNNLVVGLGSTLVNGTGFSSFDSGSFFFDATDDYFRLPTTFFNHDANTAFTVSIWFKTSTTGVVFGQQNTVNPGTISGYVPAIYVDTNGKLRTSCFWGGATSNQSVSTASVNDDKWHLVTVTFESSSHKSYLDGILFDTITKNQVSYTSPYYYFIGSGTNASWTNVGTMTFNGNIANFIFYTRALSALEVLQNYNAMKGRYII